MKSSQSSAPAQHLVFVDSIIAGVAQIIEKDGQGALTSYHLPAALLPPDAQEGSWVDLQVRVVPPPPGEDPTELRRRLSQGDDGGDLTL